MLWFLFCGKKRSPLPSSLYLKNFIRAWGKDRNLFLFALFELVNFVVLQRGGKCSLSFSAILLVAKAHGKLGDLYSMRSEPRKKKGGRNLWVARVVYSFELSVFVCLL